MKLTPAALRWQLSRGEFALAMQQAIAETRAHVAAVRRQTARTYAFLLMRGYR
jgi:hypothetical protein